jgi:glycine/D-amino acid oxidase-like deaminating enzyme
MRTKKLKIHILGGGIIGMSTAWHLSSDTEVIVYERDPTYTESSFARSCGGFRSQYFTPTNIAMSLYSINFIKKHTNVEFTANGYLMLFGKNQQKDYEYSYSLQREIGATTTKLDRTGIIDKFKYLDLTDIDCGCVTLDGSEGWLDPVSLHTWYKQLCQTNGVKFVTGDAIDFDHKEADAIVITSGCWSNEVGKHFGINIPVRGHKHTVFNVKTSKPVIKNMPLVSDLTTGVYVRPEGEGYIVGYDGNADWESNNLDPDYSSWDEVWLHLYRRFPSIFDEAKMVGAWAGYYDSSMIDNNAIIDNIDNVYFATGFTGRGLMHSPAVGLTLKEMILNKPLTFDVSNYKLDRVPNVEKYVI